MLTGSCVVLLCNKEQLCRDILALCSMYLSIDTEVFIVSSSSSFYSSHCSSIYRSS